MEDKRPKDDAPNEPHQALYKTNTASTPVYEKPVIRKYDQIDQVKPYGPSELEAG